MRTAKVEQIVPVERCLVELVDLHEDVAVDVLAQRALASRLVRDERLQHGAYLRKEHYYFVDGRFKDSAIVPCTAAWSLVPRSSWAP